MRTLFVAVFAIASVVALSNFAVQYPVEFQLGSVNLAELLTWGAFTYPLAFLVTDLVNRHAGVGKARAVVFAGFVVGVVISIETASPRIAIASGTAFLVAQMIDVSIFDRLRQGKWWRAPLISSVIGSLLDTLLFFSLAFAVSFNWLGQADSFAQTQTPFLTLFGEAPVWVSWAVADWLVKLLVAFFALLPYRLFVVKLAPPPLKGA